MWYLFGIVIGVVIFNVLLKQSLSKKFDEQGNEINWDECVLHKWEYNQEERLQCSVCRRFPGAE